MPEAGAGRRPKWADLPVVEAPTNVGGVAVSDAVREWARQHREGPALDLAAGRHQGSCASCARLDVLLYRSEPNDPESALVCAPCVRREARPRSRQTMCDNDPEHGPAWRNPFPRRNEYLCGACHAKSPEGVVQNRWARVMDSVEARVSLPLGVRERELCEAKDVVGVTPCRGQVKPRGALGANLCDQHAGKRPVQ